MMEETCAEPSAHDAQLASVADADAAKGAGCVIVEEHWDVQPFASVTVYVYVPAVSPVTGPTPVYGGVPPLAETAIDPLFPPAQLTLLVVLQDATRTGGCPMLNAPDAVQGSLVVTLIVYEPAESPLTVNGFEL